MDPSSRPPRKVGIADHIWELFEEMASQMGSDRDALINQAMFMFARLNGFSENGAAAGAGNGHPQKGNGQAGGNARAPQAQARPQGAPPVLAQGKGPSRPEPPPQKLDDDPVRREVAERVLETAAELERLIKGKNQNQDNSNDNDEGSGGMEGVDVEEPASDAGGGNALYLMAEGGELDRIAKDRFVIGRGKHCDFVINSGKVSREHAVIIRDGGDYFIEDLGSSNGTWFNKQRIKRRKVEDGDEYFICSEKVKLVFR